MKFLESGSGSEELPVMANSLYRALAAGDYPGAWLLAQSFLEPGRAENLSAPAAFNCGLCLFRVGEYERALMPLKRAEQLLGIPAGLGAAEQNVFIRTVAGAGNTAMLPLDPEGGEGMERYFLIRVRWLTALCLLRLDRRQEAVPIFRFLSQYHIELE